MGAIAMSGLATGAIYGLMAIGVVLVFRSTNRVNFAQGEVLMLGGYAYWLTNGDVGLGLDLVAIVAVGLTTGLLFFALTHYLMRDADELAVVIATLGISLMLINAVQLKYGGTAHQVPGWLTGDDTIRVGAGVVSANSIVLIGASLLAAALLHLWLERSRTGQAVRAAAESPENAALSGISVRRMRLLSWIGGCLFAALSGLLLAPEVNVSPHMGGAILFSGFVAAALGGFGSILGAMAGGLLIGLCEGLSTLVVDAELSTLVPFALLLAVLLVRPAGLFGGQALRSV
jgi:branched-chain amino acid transport system permease protein